MMVLAELIASTAAVTVASSVFFMVVYFLSGLSLWGPGSSFFRTLTCNNAGRAGMDWIFLAML
jgi:hypothetical protein